MKDQFTQSEIIPSIIYLCLHHFSTYTIEKDQATQSMEGLLPEIDREQIKVEGMLKPHSLNKPHPLTAIPMATPTISSSFLLSSPLTIGIIQCIIL